MAARSRSTEHPPRSLRARFSLACRGAGLAALALAGLMAACAGPSALPQLHRLASLAPLGAGAVAPAGAAAGASAGAWQLMTPVRLPQYLDSDQLFVPSGETGLRALPAQRWAEPLRDAVPRVLLADLSVLRGTSPVWTAPLPPGVAALRQLRVELLAFEPSADLQQVQLQARWTLAEPQATQPPVLHEVRLSVPVGAAVGAAGGPAAALVAAHRVALLRLAERIASTP